MWYRYLPLIVLYSPVVLGLYITNDTIITGNTDYDEDVEVESNNSLKLLDGTKHLFQENLNVDLNSLLYIYNHNNVSQASGTTFSITGSTSSFINYGNVTMDDSNANAVTVVNWTPDNFENHGTISLMASSSNQVYNGVSTFTLQPVNNFNNYGILSFSNAEVTAGSGSGSDAFVNGGNIIINENCIYVQESAISNESAGNFTLQSGTLWIKDPTSFATQSITLQNGGSILVDPTISGGPIQVDGFYQKNVIGLTSNITDYQYDSQSGILNLTSQDNTTSFDIGSCYDTNQFSIVSNNIQFSSQQFGITYIMYNYDLPSATCSSADSSITTSDYFTTVTNTVVVSLLQIDYVPGKTAYTTRTIAMESGATSSNLPYTDIPGTNSDSGSVSGTLSGTVIATGVGSLTNENASGSGSASLSDSSSVSGSDSSSVSGSDSASTASSVTVIATGVGSSRNENTPGSGPDSGSASVSDSSSVSGSDSASKASSVTVMATGVGSSTNENASGSGSASLSDSSSVSGSDSSSVSGSDSASTASSVTVIDTGVGSSRNENTPGSGPDSGSASGSGSSPLSGTLSGTVIATGLGSSLKGYNSTFASKPWLNATSADASLFNTTSNSSGIITKSIESSSGSVSSNRSSLKTLQTITSSNLTAFTDFNSFTSETESISIAAVTPGVALKNANSLSFNKVISATASDLEEYSSTTTAAASSQGITTVLTKANTLAVSTNNGESISISTSVAGASLNENETSSSIFDANTVKSETSSSKNSNTIIEEGISSSATAVAITTTVAGRTMPNEGVSSITKTGLLNTETSLITSAPPIVAISTISSNSQESLQVLTSITTAGTTTALGPISLYEAGAVGGQSIINKTWTAILGLIVVTFLN